MKKSRKHFLLVLILIALLLIVIGLVFIVKRYPGLLTVFTDQEKTRAFINQYGVRAPFILIGLQILQIVFAPIPGHLLGFAAGFVFGAVKGTMLCLVGIVVGASITFWIARIFGRRLLLTFVSHEKMHRFDNYIIHKGPFVIFVLLLMPFSPIGDIIYYFSGLTAMPFLVYLIMVIIARIPNNFVNNLIGAKAFTFTSREWIIFIVILTVLAFIFCLNRKKIENTIEKLVKY